MNVTARRKGKNHFVVERDGALPEKVDPDDGASIRRAAKKLGTGEAEITAAMLAAVAAEEAAAEDTTASDFTIEAWSAGDTGPIRVVGPDPWLVLEKSLSTGKEFHRWRSRVRLCVLDVDVRPGTAFGRADLERILIQCAGPLPVAGWLSRRGGIHFVFVADDAGTGYALTAEQKAGAFALLARGLRDPRVMRLELLASTREVPDGRITNPRRYGVEDLLGHLTKRGGADAVDAQEVERWVHGRGLHLGGRFGHEHCPFQPEPHQGRDPVVVNEDGVYCFRCAGKTGRGWAPWSWLLRGNDHLETDDWIANAAAARVHWTHADLIVQAVAPTLGAAVRRAAYAALVTIYHDPDVAAEVMSWASTAPLVRGEAAWLLWPEARPIPVSATTTRSLPWTQGRGPELERATRAVGVLKGYVPIRPTRCLVSTPTAAPAHNAVLAPVVRPTDARPCSKFMPMEEIRSVLKQTLLGFTDAHWNALLVTVLAGMRAQTAPATPSILLIDGPSGCGKGMVVHLAAGVLGGLPGKIHLSDDHEEARRSIGEAVISATPLIFMDEIGKLPSGTWGVTSPLLEVTATVSWRQLYSGPAQAPMTSAVILAGSTIPNGFTTMRELARRVARISLPEVNLAKSDTWESRLFNLVQTQAEGLLSTDPGRSIADPIREWAREQIVNDVGGWVDLAVRYGAVRLTDDDEARALNEVIRDLYRLWTEGGPECIAVKAGRHNGWLYGHLDEDSVSTPVGDVVRAWWHAEGPSARHAAMATLQTASVADALGIDLRLKARTHGKKVFLRFVSPREPDNLNRLDRTAFPRLEAP